MRFINHSTSNPQIEANFRELVFREENLKDLIKEISKNALCQGELTEKMKSNFDLYLLKSCSYFDGVKYNDEHLNMFITALNNYGFLLSRSYFLLKKQLLSYQEELHLQFQHY